MSPNFATRFEKFYISIETHFIFHVRVSSKMSWRRSKRSFLVDFSSFSRGFSGWRNQARWLPSPGRRKNKQRFLLVSQINSRWKEINDTNLGTFNLAAFKIRMFGTAGHNPSQTAVKFVKSGIVAATDFHPAIQCLDLILECAKHYNPERKTISISDGRLLVTLTPESIGEAFGIPSHHSMTYKTISRAQEVYDAGLARCAYIINK